MGTNGPGNPIIGIVIFWIAVSLILVAIGFFLRKRGMLRTRGPALAWSILCILPLFGAGFAMFTHHVVEDVTGETQSGVNEPPLQNMP